jgi:hypothetical protein
MKRLAEQIRRYELAPGFVDRLFRAYNDAPHQAHFET